MAIIGPLLLTMALASGDFGRVFNGYLIVCNASRTGAEYGSTNGFTSFTQAAWEAKIRQAVEQEMQAMPYYDANQLQVTIIVTPDSDGLYHVAVEVNYPFATVVNWPGVPSQVSLDHRVQMRRIR